MIESIGVSEFFKTNANKGVNKYVGPESKFHIPLEEWVSASSMFSRDVHPGYRNGVVLVRTSNLGWTLHDTSIIDEQDQLVATYQARMPGEEPRKSISIVRSELPTAQSVFFVLYHKDVLNETNERSCNTEWEIIAALTSSSDQPEPMHPETLIANHYRLSGGTSTGMSSEQFEEALETSVRFWKNRAKVILL